MYLGTIIFIVLNLVLNSNGDDLYPSYTLSTDLMKVVEWSNNRALAYITTVRLFDYDHHIFQYRRYPCQYFYTDEIQMNHINETSNQCLYNKSTSDYEYSFQLHLDSRHVEPYILRNIAIKCIYINCSLSLLNITYLHIGWNLKGRENNPNCSFDITRPYAILKTPYTVSEWITVRCQSLLSCNNSKSNLEQALPSNIQLIYGSSYELEIPYCSLEKSLNHVIETNLEKNNDLLKQLVEILQQGFGKSNEREQAKLKEYVDNISTTGKDKTNIQDILTPVKQSTEAGLLVKTAI